MSKSVESKLAETEAQKVALEAQVTKLAGENDTYTKRMKDMEDSIQRAMDKMKDMEAKIGEYASQKALLDDKMETTAKSLADINIVEKEDEEESEDGEEEMTTEAENSIEGVNPQMVTGQPAPKKLKGKKAKAKATTVSAPEVTGNPEVNQKFEDKKEVKAEEVVVAPVAEVVAEVAPTAEAPVVEKQAEVVAPAPVAEETVESKILSIVEKSTAELGAKFANTTLKFNELDAELAKARESLALEAKVKMEANATVQALTAKYEALLAKVSGIESNSKTVEEKVAKTVASLGVEPVSSMPTEIESVAQTLAPKTAQEIIKEWESIQDAKASRAFYVKHQDAIISATFPKKK